MRNIMLHKSVPGFTLVELLIALTIFGEIATFTIPKLIYSQQNHQYNAIAKENFGLISAAFQQMQLTGTLTTGTTAGAFTQYMNYVKYVSDGSLTIDAVPTTTTKACDGSPYVCVKLHNGSVLAYRTDASFGGNSTTNAIFFLTDPDGRVTDGTTNGPGKGMSMFIYYNGRIVDEGNLLTGTASSFTSYTADPAKVPSWFSW